MIVLHVRYLFISVNALAIDKNTYYSEFIVAIRYYLFLKLGILNMTLMVSLGNYY